MKWLVAYWDRASERWETSHVDGDMRSPHEVAERMIQADPTREVMIARVESKVTGEVTFHHDNIGGWR